MTGPRARGPKRGRGAIGAGLQAQGRGGIRRGERLPGAAPVLLPYALALLLTCAFWEASSLGVLAFSDTEKALLQERGPRDGPGVPRGDLYAVLGVPRGARPEGVSAALSRAALEWWQGEGRCAGEAPTGGVGRALEVYHAGTVLQSPVFRPAYDIAGLDALGGRGSTPEAHQGALPGCCSAEPSSNATAALGCARELWESLTMWGPQEVGELASASDSLAAWPASSQAITRGNIWEGLFTNSSPWVVLLFSPAAPAPETKALQALWASLGLRLEGMVRQGHVDALREPHVALRLSRAVARGAPYSVGAVSQGAPRLALPFILGRPQGCRHVLCLVPFPFQGPMLASALVHAQQLAAQAAEAPGAGIKSETDSDTDSVDRDSGSEDRGEESTPAASHSAQSTGEDLVSSLEYFALVGMAPPKPVPLLPLAKVGPTFFSKAPGNKVRVVVLLDEGALALPPALRFWAARLAKQTHWAGVYWNPREAPVWHKWWRVSRPPALGIYRDPRQDPLVFQGPFNASMLRVIFERYSNFELPQLRPDTAAALGCDPTNLPLPSPAAQMRWARPLPVHPGVATGRASTGSKRQERDAGTCGGEGAGAECAAEGDFSSSGAEGTDSPPGSEEGAEARAQQEGGAGEGLGMMRLLPGALTRYCAVVVSSPSAGLQDARLLLLDVQRALGRAAEALPDEDWGEEAEEGEGGGKGMGGLDLGPSLEEELSDGEGEGDGEREGGRKGDAVPVALARAWKEGRLTLAWLDGSKQTPYCSFMLGWEGAQYCRKEGKEAGVGLYLSLFRPQLPWQDHTEDTKKPSPGAPAGQAGTGAAGVLGFSLLVSLFRDGPLNDSRKIVDWMAKAVEQGDGHAQFPLSNKVPPGLLEEESVSFWDRVLEFAKGLLGKALKGLEPLLDRLGLLPYLQAGMPGWQGLAGSSDPTWVLKPIMLVLFGVYLLWRLLGRV